MREDEGIDLPLELLGDDEAFTVTPEDLDVGESFEELSDLEPKALTHREKLWLLANPYHDESGKFTTAESDADGGGAAGAKSIAGEKVRKLVDWSAQKPILQKVVGTDDADVVAGTLLRYVDGNEFEVKLETTDQEGIAAVRAEVSIAGEPIDEPDYLQMSVIVESLPDGKVMHLNKVIVPSDQRTTKVAFEMLRGAADLAEVAGVKRLEFGANIDMGGFAWARLGAQAKAPLQLAYRMRQRVRNPGLTDEDANLPESEALRGEKLLRSISHEGRTKIEAFLNEYSRSPDLPSKVARLRVEGKPVGRALLRGTMWDATMDPKAAKAALRKYWGK